MSMKTAGLALLTLGQPLNAKDVILPNKGIFVRPAQAPRAAKIQVLVPDPSSHKLRPAPSDTIFFDNQRFRLRVNAATGGYLYVLCLNSQGRPAVLFPTADTTGQDSQITRQVPLVVPIAGWFEFDSVPGVERIFLLVAPDPIPDLEDAIEQSRGGLTPSVFHRYAIAARSFAVAGALRTIATLDLLHDSL